MPNLDTQCLGAKEMRETLPHVRTHSRANTHTRAHTDAGRCGRVEGALEWAPADLTHLNNSVPQFLWIRKQELPL